MSSTCIKKRLAAPSAFWALLHVCKTMYIGKMHSLSKERGERKKGGKRGMEGGGEIGKWRREEGEEKKKGRQSGREGKRDMGELVVSFFSRLVREANGCSSPTLQLQCRF